MQRIRFYIENRRRTGCTGSPRLLDEHGDGIGLIEQAQPPIFISLPRIARIDVDAATSENAESVRNERADPTHVEVGLTRTVQAKFAVDDIGLDGGIPIAEIR